MLLSPTLPRGGEICAFDKTFRNGNCEVDRSGEASESTSVAKLPCDEPNPLSPRADVLLVISDVPVAADISDNESTESESSKCSAKGGDDSGPVPGLSFWSETKVVVVGVPSAGGGASLAIGLR